MNRPGMSINQVRIAVALLSLALFAQTAFWLLYDIVVRGLPGAWSLWTTGWVPGLSATSSLDLGLAALQLCAGLAALFRTRGAGGLTAAGQAGHGGECAELQHGPARRAGEVLGESLGHGRSPVGREEPVVPWARADGSGP